MEFGGNEFTYLTKKKITKLQDLKKKEKKLEVIKEKDEDLMKTRMQVKKDEEKKENTVRKGREKSRSRSRSRSRDSSNSLERNCSDELDEVYSCDESGDEDFDDDEEEESELFSSSKRGGRGGKQPTKAKKMKESMPQPKGKKVKINLAALKQEKKVYSHVVDTNVLSIKFGFLSNKVGYVSGDPTYCKGCNAILNNQSVLVKLDDTNTLWDCEFCRTQNTIQIEPEEIPKNDCTDFFVMSKNQVKNSDLNYSDEKSILFCFDVSGSMCVTAPVKGKHNFKGSFIERERNELMKFSDGSDQFYDPNSKGKTYISRLQCLQAAIESNLTLMKESSPNVKIGFVSFNNEVVGIGDGTQAPVKINGNNLNDPEYIRTLGLKNTNTTNKPIKETYDFLLKHLYSIEESGQTALGPAILFCVNLLEGASAGSKIILCTDGIANIGISSIEGISNPSDVANLESFYREVGKQAKQRGIIISLITFEGEESKTEILSAMAQETGGEIIRVKPAQILEQFSNLLTSEVLASNVKINIKLHKILRFRNTTEDDQLQDNESTLVREIGNVTNESELYAEYAFKKANEISKMDDIDIEKLEKVPFQSIIHYTNKNGDKCIRVMTNSQKINTEKDQVEKQAKYNVISINAMQKTSHLAKEGKYREAQSNALAWKKMMKHNQNSNESSNAAYNMFNRNVNVLNNDLQKYQYEEMSLGAGPYQMFQGYNQPNYGANFNAMQPQMQMPQMGGSTSLFGGMNNQSSFGMGGGANVNTGSSLGFGFGNNAQDINQFSQQSYQPYQQPMQQVSKEERKFKRNDQMSNNLYNLSNCNNANLERMNIKKSKK